MLKAKKVNVIHLVILALLVVYVSYPLFTNYIIKGINTLDSLTRISLISDNIGKVFPVRIGPISNLSYGYGATSFQADLFLLIPAILNIFGLSVQSAYKVTIFLINAATAIISYYSFSKCFKNKELGLIGSFLYTCCPIRCYDLYLHGILGESIAWVFIPLVIYGSILFLNKENSFNVSVLGFSLIIMSSFTIFFITACMFILILAVNFKKVIKKDKIMELVKISITTLCICGWYLIPMLLRMRDLSAVGCMLTPNIRYSGKYVAEYLMPMKGAGISAIFLLFVFLYHWFIGEYKKELKDFVVAKKFVVVSFILILLSSRLFPWDLLENKNMLGSILLAIMEVPERWSVVASICIIIVACGVLSLYKNKFDNINMKRIYIGVGAVSLFFLHYQLGTILYTADTMHVSEDMLQIIPFQIVSDVSIIWRLAECVSITGIIIIVVISMLRRKNRVE